VQSLRKDISNGLEPPFRGHLAWSCATGAFLHPVGRGERGAAFVESVFGETGNLAELAFRGPAQERDPLTASLALALTKSRVLGAAYSVGCGNDPPEPIPKRMLKSLIFTKDHNVPAPPNIEVITV
jgi:hypothetical protein